MGGIIPARAGFTRSRSRSPTPTGDHPRSRGVYLDVCVSIVHSDGSSPLARGLRRAATAATARRRIIPARAGFTRWSVVRGRRRTDHPRSRGVYAGTSFKTMLQRGSSPLARGLPLRLADLDPPGRIIPARAGFTRPSRRCPATPGDHPRSRGVYSRARPFACSRAGSSPLARGLPLGVGGRSPVSRIIPARAGFTGNRSSRSRTPWDHPRSRGVYEDRAVVDAYVGGSSPLARGLLTMAMRAADVPRIIPARAGFT